jgi:hypothetical protein
VNAEQAVEEASLLVRVRDLPAALIDWMARA